VAKKRVLEAVAYLAQCLREAGIDVARVILFGSHARGEAGEESDIDVAVVSEDFRGTDIFGRADVIGQAHWRVVSKYHIPMDIVALTPEELDSSAAPVAQYVRAGTAV
jgi:predicted nucleotidyltransferase